MRSKNNISICLDCPITNGCVEDEDFQSNGLECPLKMRIMAKIMTSTNEYITLRELAAIIDIPYATIYSRRTKLKKLLKHKTVKSPKNHQPTFYVHREDALAAADEIKATGRPERKVQIVFGIKQDAKDKLKEIARERNMPSLAMLLNEIVMEYLEGDKLQ